MIMQSCFFFFVLFFRFVCLFVCLHTLTGFAEGRRIHYLLFTNGRNSQSCPSYMYYMLCSCVVFLSLQGNSGKQGEPGEAGSAGDEVSATMYKSLQ